MLPKLILQHLYWIYMLKIVYSNSFLCLYFRVNNSTDHARYVHKNVFQSSTHHLFKCKLIVLYDNKYVCTIFYFV